MGDYSGWRLVFGLLALAFAIIFPANYFAWHGSNYVRPNLPPNAAAQESLRGAMLYLVCMALWGASVYAGYTMLSTALEAEYHLPAGGVATVLTSFGLGATIGSLRGGHMADRIGALQMVRWCFVMMVFANVCLFFVYPMHSVWALSLNMFVLALVAYGFFPALQAAVASRFILRRPTVMGLLSSSLYIGITTGASTGGLVYATTGMRGVIVLAATLALAGTGAAFLLHTNR